MNVAGEWAPILPGADPDLVHETPYTGEPQGLQDVEEFTNCVAVMGI